MWQKDFLFSDALLGVNAKINKSLRALAPLINVKYFPAYFPSCAWRKTQIECLPIYWAMRREKRRKSGRKKWFTWYVDENVYARAIIKKFGSCVRHRYFHGKCILNIYISFSRRIYLLHARRNNISERETRTYPEGCDISTTYVKINSACLVLPPSTITSKIYTKAAQIRLWDGEMRVVYGLMFYKYVV